MTLPAVLVSTECPKVSGVLVGFTRPAAKKGGSAECCLVHCFRRDEPWGVNDVQRMAAALPLGLTVVGYAESATAPFDAGSKAAVCEALGTGAAGLVVEALWSTPPTVVIRRGGASAAPASSVKIAGAGAFALSHVVLTVAESTLARPTMEGVVLHVLNTSKYTAQKRSDSVRLPEEPEVAVTELVAEFAAPASRTLQMHLALPLGSPMSQLFDLLFVRPRPPAPAEVRWGSFQGSPFPVALDAASQILAPRNGGNVAGGGQTAGAAASSRTLIYVLVAVLAGLVALVAARVLA